jgi:hypothetical protein
VIEAQAVPRPDRANQRSRVVGSPDSEIEETTGQGMGPPERRHTGCGPEHDSEPVGQMTVARAPGLRNDSVRIAAESIGIGGHTLAWKAR